MSVQRESELYKLWTLIKGSRFPVITTHQSGNGLHSRPIALCNREGDSLEFLWFLMPGRSEPVYDLQWDTAVGLIFAAPNQRDYIAAFGSAVVFEDANLKRQFWSSEMQGWFPDAQAWFPSGVGDPAVALIRFKVIRADYWDIQKNSVTHMFSLQSPGRDEDPPPNRGGNGPLHV